MDLVSTQKPQRHIFLGVVWRDTMWLEILDCNKTKSVIVIFIFRHNRY